MRHRASLLIALVALALPLAGQSPVTLPPEVRAAADRITSADLARDLEFLASDELLGRNTPSPGFDTAAAYIAERLARAGVKPFGDDGTFYQRYEMRESTVDTDASYIQIGARRFGFGEEFVMRSFAGPLTGTLPVVYVGHGWTVPEEGINPYAAVDVRGKIVLAHGPRALPKDVRIRQIGRVTVGANSPFVEAERRGAAGIVFVPQAAALERWDAARTQSLVRRELEPRVPSAYAALPVTAILLARSATDALLDGERVTGAELIARGDAMDYPASFQLEKSLTLDITAETIVHHPYNVVGLIEGGDPVLRDEYITIESHLDGAVGTGIVEGDGIYNSADDNASGSAANLAIAEQMVRVRPRRSLIFIWDSGEEQGLWGTRHFVHEPPVPLDRIVAHFNIDMIGANRAPGSPDRDSPEVTGPGEVYVIGPRVLSSRAEALMDEVNRAYLNLTLNPAYDRPDSEFFYPRTDAGPFLERGILTIGFFTGLHGRYHQPADEARFLDPKKMEAISRTIFAAIWAFATVEERPGIDKPIPPGVPRYR